VLAACAAGAAIKPCRLAAAEICSSVIESGWALAETQKDAEQRAILWWSSRAAALGKGYESWDRAQRKKLLCEPRQPAGGIQCKAFAAPCLPEGLIPPPKAGDKAIGL